METEHKFLLVSVHSDSTYREVLSLVKKQDRSVIYMFVCYGCSLVLSWIVKR